MHRYAYTILKSQEEASDMVQLAYIKLWEKRNEADIHHAGRAYLYTTVYRLCLNNIRNKKVREQYVHHQPKTATPADTRFTIDEKEISNKIHNALETLPGRCREVFCKSRFEGKKYAEIATELNISVKTVEVQMGKALKILRTMLADIAAGCLVLLYLL